VTDARKIAAIMFTDTVNSPGGYGTSALRQ